MLNRYWLLLAAILLIASCKSGEKLYNRGHYDEAVTAFVKKLRKRPTNETSLALLPKAYAQARQLHEDKANGWLASNDELKWEHVRVEYGAMQQLYNTIQTSPAAMAVVKPKDYRNAIAGAKENAAEVRYDRGMAFLDQGDKESARRAFDEFQACLSIVGNYRDAGRLSQEAYDKGVVRVVISEIAVASSYFQFNADVFRDALVRDLQARNISRFVQFIDERVARANKVQPDQYLQMHFADFMVGQTYVDRTERDLNREIVISTSKDTSGREVKRYGKVKARMYINKTSIVSRGLLDYQLSEVGSNNVIRASRLPGQYTWENMYVYYKGDERALSDEDKKQLGGSDIAPPPAQDLFMLLTRPIYDQLTTDMIALYRTL